MGGADEVATEEGAPEGERTPIVIEGKRHAVDETEQVVGKRLRVPSQYVVSPFTTEAKRRTFIDGTYPNLFREVDNAKWKAFETEWRRIIPGATRMIGNRTVSDAYKWFHNIMTAGVWLADDHIDLAMDLLRDRAQRHPKSFDVHGRVILNTELLRAVTIEYQSLQLMGNEYTVLEYMLEWVIVLSPSVGGKSWESCTHMYIPACINRHCVMLEIVFVDTTIYVYDPDHSCLTQGQLEQNLESVAVIVPMMARQAGMTVQDRLQIVRNTTTSR